MRFLGTIFWLYLVCVVLTFSYQPRVETIHINHDPRRAELSHFFAYYKCPAPYYITEYLNAADKYGLDFRVLAAISIRESSCGKHYRLNNFWGWNSANTGFSSIPEGIDYISNQLMNGHYYKDKTLKQKLTAYNNAEYADNIIFMIGQIK